MNAIKTDNDLLRKFCNPTDVEQDHGYSLTVTSQVDETGDSTNYIVDLGIIFHGPTQCNDDDTHAQCEVVIGEDLSIKSSDCVDVNDLNQNEGKNEIYLSY